MKNVKLYGIKKAVGEAQKWESKSFGNVSNIMFDTETGEVWCDVFTDCNTWIKYHKESVHSITRYIKEWGMIDKIGMAEVKIACEEMRNLKWN